MTTIRLEDKFINYVRNSVDLVVGKTGYPVLGKYLIETGIATRQQLRLLEKKKLLKSIDVKVKNPHNLLGTIYKAYYTERNIPQYVKEQQGEEQPSEE